MRLIRKIPLLAWIIIAILLGILVGWASRQGGTDVPVRVFATFGMVFSELLGFAIPLIILGFIAPGIGSIGRGAGKLLGKAVAIAYTSTVLAGIMALLSALALYPHILKGATATAISDPSASLVKPYGVTVDANGGGNVAVYVAADDVCYHGPHFCVPFGAGNGRTLLHPHV